MRDIDMENLHQLDDAFHRLDSTGIMSQKVFIEWFSKVNSPTNPSTYPLSLVRPSTYLSLLLGETGPSTLLLVPES
jgi:hypothetical protein